MKPVSLKLQLKHPAIYCLYGKPASGKSNLIRYIIAHYQKKRLCDFVFVMSGSAFNQYYQSFLPDNQVKNYSDDVLERLLNLCAKKKENGQRFRVLLVLDDCIGSARWKSPIVMRMISNHRHYNITITIASQYPKAVPPNIRSNANLGFVFYARTKPELEALFESYGVGFMDNSKQFADLLKTLKDYECLVINSRERNFNKSFRKFKCPLMSKKK